MSCIDLCFTNKIQIVIKDNGKCTCLSIVDKIEHMCNPAVDRTPLRGHIINLFNIYENIQH